ncbi:MAG TPA: alpha-glucan family phosphorylase, partial [Candidatus Paceibacterota bacterium]|nr:alpha-glucan family phosphorylase [Candidatus Paceibacterota bacterium]
MEAHERRIPITVIKKPGDDPAEDGVCMPAMLEEVRLIEGISMPSLSVAYFCMEIGLENDLPTYAGGLGVLAGDMLKSCADLEVSVIGISLLYRKGYFRQRIDQSGWQTEVAEEWNPYEKLVLLPEVVTIELEGRTVSIRAWLYKLKGIRGTITPVIFLDTDMEANAPDDRGITHSLYGGDVRYRLLQEAVLGIGGIRMLKALGAEKIEKFHMNEGHSALLTLELYRRYAECSEPIEEVRRRCVFTTHTPVSAGHDQFGRDLASHAIGTYLPAEIDHVIFQNDVLNMTHLGFQMSRFINGVAKKHGEVTRDLFPGYQIESITNGVHATRWVSEPFKRLYDKYLPGWQADPYSLRYALSIPGEELWRTHEEAKRALATYVNERYNSGFDPDAFTIGFARRAAQYKRG